MLEKVIKYGDIKKMVKKVSQGLLKGILGYTEDQVVSSILTVTPVPLPLMLGLASSLVTTLLSSLPGMTNGYSNSVVDLEIHMASK